MTVDIVCPLYNAANYLQNLINALKKQKNVQIDRLRFILTESTDATRKILDENNCDYVQIKKNEFSHSLTRETEAMASSAEIVVFITQDVLIEREDWLAKLIAPIVSGECEASFSRQISRYKNIEKYTREKNYPQNSYLVSKDDIDKLGLQVFFFSDAASAIKTSVFKQLNGYDGKNLPTNEDMYIAYKIIMAGYKIKYCADSVVCHAHKFTLRQLYQRYYKFGEFMAQNPEIYRYGTTKAGSSLAKYIFRRALQEFNVPVLLRFIPDMLTRWLGLHRGIKAGNRQ